MMAETTQYRTAFNIPDTSEDVSIVNLNIKLPRNLREAFHRECRRNHIMMGKAVQALLHAVVSRKLEIPVHPDDIPPSSYDGDDKPIVTRES